MRSGLIKKIILYVTLILAGSFAINIGWILYLHEQAMTQLLHSSNSVIQEMLQEQQVISAESERLKAERIAKLLAQMTPSFIVGYELSTLSDFAKNATDDPDISYAEILNTTGSSLAVSGNKDDVVKDGFITVDIIAEDTPLGKVVVGYNQHRSDAHLSQAQQTTNARLTELETRKQSSLKTMRFSLGGGLLLSLVVTILLLVGFFARSITTPLGKGVELVNRLNQGDLTINIDVAGKDEISQWQLALRTMVGTLKQILASVKIAAEQVNSGSQNMSTTAAQMSSGVGAQAAAAEEASSSVEEMGANIRQNAENAAQTEKIALKAAQDAQESGNAVAIAVDAMRNIAKKILVIDDISRQTRMLSLNATIEAARAQDYGRGFAVVAAEVRALAERSQAAAAEITQLASSAVALAENAGNMLKKLVPDIQQTAGLVQEISAASKEQNAGTEQINRAIQQLDQVTQQNSTTSEELAATAEELARQAEQLQHAIAFFNIDAT